MAGSITRTVRYKPLAVWLVIFMTAIGLLLFFNTDWFMERPLENTSSVLTKIPTPTHGNANKGRPSQKDVPDYENGWSIPDDPGFIRYLREKWMHPPSKTRPKMAAKDYSQLGEHKVVDDLLKQRQNGVFFEVGALDGITYSNTLGLELIRNWTGILVEPDPTQFAKLLKLNRNVYSFNACLSSNKSEKMTFVQGAAKGALVDTLRYKRTNKRSITVQCFPLYSLLLAVGITKIDFFSLDVEGAEEMVLESLPMDKVDVGLFVIEYLDVEASAKARRLTEFKRHFEKIAGYNYRGEHHGVDVIFQKW